MESQKNIITSKLNLCINLIFENLINLLFGTIVLIMRISVLITVWEILVF